jgi:hypothetical protein
MQKAPLTSRDAAMLFLTAVMLGLAAASLRSVGALAAVASLIPASFAATAVVSTGSASLADLGFAVLGVNAGAMTAILAAVAIAAIHQPRHLSR